jgi:hypothetical protein
MEYLGGWHPVGGFVFALAGAGLRMPASLELQPGQPLVEAHIEGRGGVLDLPIATSLVLSIILTMILNVLLRSMRHQPDGDSDARARASHMP